MPLARSLARSQNDGHPSAVAQETERERNLSFFYIVFVEVFK